MTNGKTGKYLSIAAVFCAGVILTAGATYLAYRADKARIESIFNDASEYRFKYIEDTVQHNITALESFGDFYKASVSVEKSEFESFAEGALSRNPAILEFRRNERVRDEERALFEQEARKVTGIADFHIKELDKDDRIVIAGRRKEYFPIYFITSSTAHKCDYNLVTGLDAASFPERWESMRRARDTAEPSVATEIKLIGEPAIASASRIFLPIYKNGVLHDTLEERAENLTGFVAILYSVADSVNKALTGIPSVGIDIAVYEDIPNASPRLLYFRPAPSRKNPNDPAIEKDLLQKKKKGTLLWSGSTAVADSKWLIICFPSPEFYQRYRVILPWGVLITGLFFTLGLSSYFASVIGRAKVIETLIQTRTEQLRKAKEDLEIEARDLAKANEGIKALYKDLAAANEQLKGMDQLKNDFVSIVSHELRTPLAIMKEGVSLVLDNITGDIGEKTRHMLETVFSNINRLAKLINDLLDISKIESGKIVLKKAVVDACAIINDMSEQWKLEADKKKQSIIFSCLPDKVEMYIDPDKIEQVISNLLSNAIKFTPEGGRIEIAVRDGKDALEVSISDSGVGISREDLPKVFTKFQQFGRTAGGGAKGTGLGLAISRELVMLHEGAIKVESKEDVGTKFTFTLPKKDSETVFKEEIAKGVKEAEAEEMKLSVISIRMPEFPTLQNKIGLDKAQKLYKDLERLMAGQLRRKDDLVVKGSAEFIIILINADKAGAKSVLERLEAAIRSYLAEFGDEDIKELGLKIGLASYPSDAKTVEELFNTARASYENH